MTALKQITSDRFASLPAPAIRSDTQPAKYWTDAKIKKTALYVFATIAALAGPTLILTSIVGIIPWPFAFASVALFASSAGLIYWASQIKDYENPIELHKMKEKARLQSYSELVQEHGLSNIQIYRIVSPEMLQEKFQFQETTRLIDLKYQNRQERLLRNLSQKEYMAEERAHQKTNTVIQTGYAATQVATAFQKPDPNKTFAENANDQQRTRLQGFALTQLAAIPAYALSNQCLQQELDEIAAEKTRILEKKIGLEEQRAYVQEMKIAQQAHYMAEAALLRAEAE